MKNILLLLLVGTIASVSAQECPVTTPFCKEIAGASGFCAQICPTGSILKGPCSQQGATCRCCQPNPNLCPLTPPCQQRGGKCVTREVCEEVGNGKFIFDITLCSNPNTCGCCYPPTSSPTLPTQSPTKPCPQTEKCKARDGKCTKKDQCTKKNWVPELCDFTTENSDNGCGCCYDDPTPSPTKPCENTEDCKKKEGICMAREKCASIPDTQWIPRLCNPLATGTDCGCCIKNPPTSSPTEPTQSPTKPCVNSRICKFKGGKCTKREDCLSDPTNEWIEQFCNLFGAGSNCGCCRKKPITQAPTIPTPSPTRPCQLTSPCKIKGGKCTKKAECPVDQAGVVWSESLCKLPNSDVNQECGCCYKETPSPTLKPTPVCTDSTICTSTGGKCVKRDICDQLGSSYEFILNLCTPNFPDDNCGCCRPKATSAPTSECKQTDACKQKNGKCLTREECPLEGFEFRPQLCAISNFPASEKCGCCIKSAVDG